MRESCPSGIASSPAFPHCPRPDKSGRGYSYQGRKLLCRLQTISQPCSRPRARFARARGSPAAPKCAGGSKSAKILPHVSGSCALRGRYAPIWGRATLQRASGLRLRLRLGVQAGEPSTYGVRFVSLHTCAPLTPLADFTHSRLAPDHSLATLARCRSLPPLRCSYG